MKYTSRLQLAAIGIALSTLFLFSCRNTTDRSQFTISEQLTMLDNEIKKSPKDAHLYYERGKLLIEQQHINEAINDLQRACELDEDQTAYQIALSDAYFANGNVSKSYQALQKALNLEPDNMEALLKMGEVTFFSRDFDRSLETLTKVTERDPDNRTALFMKAYIYKEKGDTAAAARLYRRVSEVYPDYAPAFEELGMLYAAGGRDLAVEYLTTAIRLDSANTNAMYNLAMFYQEKEEAELAEEWYVRMLEVEPHNKYAWHNRGYIEMLYFEDYDAAIDLFSQAIACDADYVEAYTNRALCYELKGDRTNARISYQAALNIDPDYKQAVEGLARVK